MSRTTYTVGPIENSKRWAVRANGRRVSRHNKKSAAVKKAKDLADRNDTISVRKKNGKFQKRI